ncbi:kinesin-like protein KIF28 [Clavelina lepadiformis]|uniref:kinesin-like protein KIF28 n=1 Tax=Clavelina lepadiformis TaxID=159417 RepID=UPI004041BE23
MPLSGGDSIKVAVRVRPFNQRELSRKAKCVVSMQGNSTTITNPTNKETKQFSFDYSYWSHDGYVVDQNGRLIQSEASSRYADQMTVFDDLGRGVLQNAWAGYNATLFAYGQTGSGKSYSMVGHGSNKGIVPITCGNLFRAIDEAREGDKELQVTFSMLEIYNEQTRDLLFNKSQHKSTNLKVRENRDVGFYVEGLTQHPCRDYNSVEQLMEVGAINRTTAATNMNATSSRSHMVISIKFKQIFNNDLGESTTKTSEINLVDLAGSERAESSGATGDRLKEGSAINRSLLMLGTVIETLATADPKSVVPYRDSVLTKLLKSALGGNSKTVMIAALSPADINYEETLSTLRYANRAKKIKNRAVVNESPTDKLIRQLKAENARLLAQLSRKSPHDGVSDNSDVQRLLTQNERQMKEMMTSWEQKLETARKEWEAEQRSIEGMPQQRNQCYPYLQNVNEDPQLSGIIKHPIYDGVTNVGRCSKQRKEEIHYIVLRGLGIQEEHFIIRSNGEGKVIMEPCANDDVTINGRKILIQTSLNHGDRLKVGSNSLFLFIGFPSERSRESVESVTERCNFDFFQNELLTYSDITHELPNTSPRAKRHKNESITDAVYAEYIRLVPVVASMNAISQELKKERDFELFVKNLATYDARGNEIPKEIAVEVRHQVTDQVWIWSKSKFINRRYMIEELYMKHQDDPTWMVELSEDLDPFWDPVEDIYLGCAHVWLHSLSYNMPLDDQVPINNDIGEEVAILQVSMNPCTPTKEMKGEDSLVIDPTEMVGKRMDFIINIPHCLGVEWIREKKSRGAMLRFKFYDEEYGHETAAVWRTINPSFNMEQLITVERVDQDLLHYLNSSALIVELWGLQEGRTGKRNSRQDSGFFHVTHTSPTPSPSMSSSSSDVEMLESELREAKKMLKERDEDNQDLRRICNVLKKENSKLRKKFEARIATEHEKGATRSGTSHVRHINNTKTKPSGSNRAQAELGRALKCFFSDIRPLQQNLARMTSHNGFKGNKEIEKLSEDLDATLLSLKQSVSNAVRLQQMERPPPIK